MKEIIYFAHGNGFPSPCYRQFLDEISLGYNVSFIEKVGHKSEFPVSDNWGFLVEELIQNIESTASKPVIAVGHSLGGALSFMASILRPDLFKLVIMIDSPLINRFKSRMVKLAKNMGFIDRLTPAHKTKRRQKIWANEDKLYTYLKKRPLFKTFTEECLKDYMHYGCKKTNGGLELVFDPSIEYQIYRTIPHNLYKFEGKNTVPIALVVGKSSKVVDSRDIHYMSSSFGVRCYSIMGTHMVPMEHPKELGRLIKIIIQEMS